MQHTVTKQDLKTVIIKYEQQPNRAGPFRIWFQELWIHTVTSSGFKSFEIIPAASGEYYHTVLLHFNSHDEAQQWMVSQQRAKLLDSKTLYFLAGEEESKNKKTPTSRICLMLIQAGILFVALLPLSFIISFTTNSLFKGYLFERLLQTSIFALLISVILVFIIIPIMSRLLSRQISSN